MPADRLLHARLGHSAKVGSLSELEFRVWTTYVLAADDFGVMRADAVAFQAAHDALSTRLAEEIGKCIERLVEGPAWYGVRAPGRALRVPGRLAGFPAGAVPRADAAPASGLGRGQREDALPVVRPSGRRPGPGASEELRHYFRTTSEVVPQNFRRTSEHRDTGRGGAGGDAVAVVGAAGAADVLRRGEAGRDRARRGGVPRGERGPGADRGGGACASCASASMRS